MKTYICILRGINVSGHNIVKMNELKTLAESLLFQNVQTYIQSGNIVFQSNNKFNNNLESEIKSKMLENFGLDIPVFVIAKDELELLILHNPFKNKNVDSMKLHVTFLLTEPNVELKNRISEMTFGGDEFVIHGKAIYLYCPNGYGKTKLSNSFFETKLKVITTTRNWKTVNQLLEIANSLS
ncbi:MAG: DUF1697 domain-containing protein [Bacteroidetes bacterium]|nr:DUF1697 domain-containing protein [Bacteroidota bacterium]